LQDNGIGSEGRTEISQSLAQLNPASVELQLQGTDLPHFLRTEPESEVVRAIQQSLTPLRSMFSVSPVAAAARAGRDLAAGAAFLVLVVTLWEHESRRHRRR